MMAATVPATRYSPTPLVAKLGLKDGQCVGFVKLANDRQGLPTSRDVAVAVLTELAAFGEAGERHGVVHAFTGKRAALDAKLENFKKMIAPDGAVWISWPKKVAKIVTDVTEDVICEVSAARGGCGRRSLCRGYRVEGAHARHPQGASRQTVRNRSWLN